MVNSVSDGTLAVVYSKKFLFGLPIFFACLGFLEVRGPIEDRLIFVPIWLFIGLLLALLPVSARKYREESWHKQEAVARQVVSSYFWNVLESQPEALTLDKQGDCVVVTYPFQGTQERLVVFDNQVFVQATQNL